MLITDGLQPNDRGNSAFWANLHKDVKSGKAEKMLTAFPTRYISFELIEISDGSNFFILLRDLESDEIIIFKVTLEWIFWSKNCKFGIY